MLLELNPVADGVERFDVGRFDEVRALSTALAALLTAEDQCVQSMPDASPIKWHLAHTTWFFERLILARDPDYKPFDPHYDALFNSYYLELGTPFSRPHRGLLTRPGADDIAAYRAHVDAAMARLIARGKAPSDLVQLGLNHEQQHQELMLTDIKHAFWCNPLRPAYAADAPSAPRVSLPLVWRTFSGGVVEIGHRGPGFAFDNEGPPHQVLLRPYRLASRLVTCAEYFDFMEDGGYRRPEFWLSDGWSLAQSEGWRAPLYWLDDRARGVFTLHGVEALNPGEPVVHLSFYEAHAYAKWAGKRLPTEFEWENAAAQEPQDGRVLDRQWLRPRAAEAGRRQMFGDAWEWTQSAYSPYPGYRPYGGALAEYNGKFMIGQMVLRGGSCVTPPGHVRATYRNFFPPSARWQFSGIRLAEDA
jgi:ergothioneine biosynthesis protein EgtB